MNHAHLARTVTSTLLAALVATQIAVAAPAPKKASWVPPAPPDAVTHHVVGIGGSSIAYTARAGNITLRNGKEQVTAHMFYVAYTKDGTGSNRPITFLYNGGPGSSTIWLHMASVGPVRVVTADGAPTGPPPYRIVDNQYSLLDKTDLVFVDAPNTGYSRVLGAGEPKDFMGVDQDAQAFSQFVRRYITQFKRWNSPKFLFGESYGTTRSCVLVNLLQSQGVQFNGVVLQSSILNFGLGGGPIAGGDWNYVLDLPTEAATAWYHKKVAGNTANLNAFLARVQQFATGEYFHALADGDTLSASQRADVVSKLHDYIGISQTYVRNANLRIPYSRFLKELLRNRNVILGRYDSRFQTYGIDTENATPDWDPSDVGISGAFVGAFHTYLTNDLHYHTNLPYRPVAYGELGAPWDMHHDGNDPPANVAPDLAQAMTQNPHLRVFSANGRYDFATPYFATVYTLEHLNIAPALQNHITYRFYRSGHMIYLHVPALAKYKADLARWYDTTLSTR